MTSEKDESCRICGLYPKPWEQLEDGVCEDCRFEHRIEAGDYP